MRAGLFDDLDEQPTKKEARYQRKYHAINNLGPFCGNHACKAVQGNSAARYASDKAVRFRAGNAEEPTEDTP